MSDNKRTRRGMFGKGYYIALILCAAAIGITGYMYYRNTDLQPDQLQESTIQADATHGEDISVAAPSEDISGSVNTTLPPAPAKDSGKRAKPVSGETIAEYSMDALCYNQTTRDWRVHDGMDIAAEAGSPVCAAADGTVYTVYEDETMGMTVVLSHAGGYTSKYASLASDVAVAPGDTVTAGQTIGYVGNTALFESAIGDHVHFSVSCNGELVDPLDFLG